MKLEFAKKMIARAEHVASFSKDRSMKTGAVIVKYGEIVSEGRNEFPKGIDYTVEERYERPLKYKFTEHAERNAIYSAAKNGKSTKGGTVVMRWFPCSDCMRAIIQSGISGIVCETPSFVHPTFGDDFRYSKIMLDESSVNVAYMDQSNFEKELEKISG